MTDNLPAILAGKLALFSQRVRMHIDEWAGIGEDLAMLETLSPWALGDWYAYGVDEYGATVTINLIKEVKRLYPNSFLARKSLKTFQNYSSVSRAFPISKTLPIDQTLRAYEFWHCEAVLGVPEDCRLFLLEAGRTEEMSVAQFRAFVAEQSGRIPSNGRSAPALEAQASTLAQANGELHQAVEDLSEELAAIKAQRAAEIGRRADERLQDEPYAGAEDAYRRDCPEEWVEDAPRVGFTCPACGVVTTIRFLDLPDIETGAVIRCPDCWRKISMRLEIQ